MADGLAGGRLIDFILALVALEILVFATYRRMTGRGISLADLFPNILAGAFLLLALRLTLTGAGWMPVCGCLAGAGLAHIIDLGRRWRH